MFDRIEKRVNTQLARAERAIHAKSGLSTEMWQDFNGLLDDCIYTAACLAKENYALHECLPSQKLLNQLQFLNECLTTLGYGRPNINCMYHFFIKLHEDTGLLAYTGQAYTQTRKITPDHHVAVYDESLRKDKTVKHQFRSKRAQQLTSYSALTFQYGKNPLDHIYVPGLLTSEQNRVLLSRSGLIKIGLKILQYRQRRILKILEKHQCDILNDLCSGELKKMHIEEDSTAYRMLKKQGKVIENWGQLDPETAKSWLNQIRSEETDIQDVYACLAFHYQNQPNEYFMGMDEDRALVELGLLSDSLVKKNPLAMQNKSISRYLNFSWKRLHAFEYVDSRGQTNIARERGVQENHRVMPNHMPYVAAHGIVVSGTGDSLRDPHANQPNTRLDIEMMHRIVEFFNPPLSAQALPCEKVLLAFQNPRISSSILATGHCHLARADIGALHILKIQPVRKHSFSNGESLNVIQVGKKEDALIVHLTHENTHYSLLETISSLMCDLRETFDGSDMGMICFPAQGLYHTLLIPACKLRADHENEIIYNARNKSDLSFGISTYHCNPRAILGQFNIRYDNKMEHQTLAQGSKAIEAYSDFIAIDGMKEHLFEYLNISLRRPSFSI